MAETQPVISDAATFMEEVPRMHAEEAEHAARETLEDLEYELNPPGQPVGTHRGVLAGLDIKERERAINVYIDTKPFDLLDEEGAEPQPHIITLMEEQRVAGKPDQPLDRLLGRLRVDQVRNIAQQLQVPHAHDLRKAELVEAVVEALADSTRVHDALFGVNEMRAQQLKRMVESGRDCSEVLIQLSAVKAAITSPMPFVTSLPSCVPPSEHLSIMTRTFFNVV